MQVGGLKTNPSQQESWRDFLRRTALSLACLLLGSAGVCWVAANWQQASGLQKLGGAQVLLAVFVIFAALACRRRSKGSEHNFSLAGNLAGLAAIATGALLALVGQIYQTGADAWQLFLLWAILILPWLLVMRTAFLALLIATLCNVSLSLYLNLASPAGWGWLGRFDLNSSAFALAGLNILLLAAWEIFRHHLADRWRVGPRLLAAAVIAWWLVAILAGAGSGSRTLIPAIPGLALMAAFYFVYTRWRPDLGLVSLALLGVFVFAVVPMLDVAGGEVGLFVIIVVLAALAALGVRHLIGLARLASSHSDSEATAAEPWFVAMFRMVVISVIAVLIVVFLALVLNISEDQAWMVGIGMALLGAAAYRLSSRNMWRDTAIILTASGVFILTLGIFITGFDPFLAVLALLLVGALVYLAVPNVVLRFLAALIILGAVTTITWPGGIEQLFFALLDNSAGVYLFDAYLRVWLATVLALLALVAAGRRGREGLLGPLAWSLVIVAQTWAWWAPAPTLLNSVSVSSWTSLLWFAIALLPVLVLGALLWGCRQLPLALRVGAPLVLALASVGWVGASGISLSLLWLMLGHALHRRGLLAFGVLALVGYLGRFYYQLDVSLLDKSLLLGLTGGWLLLAWLLAIRVRTKASGEPQTLVKRASRWQSIGLMAGLVIVLIVANSSIYRYEGIIKNGDRVVLALAPVDPRSLMQGDYMALDYVVARQVEFLLANSGKDPHMQALTEKGHGYLLLRPGVDGVYALAQVLAQRPEHDAAANQASVLLEFRLRAGEVSIVTNAWFFPEGKGDHYAQARYGEFRVNDSGTGLLVGMLDERLQPL